ncbi:hypothetical protein ON010_g6694 [Phytophthora cinnamomi]|nr:hypothetical protein ON010_g6694 [Phytophthora cinnamomi]
MTPATRPSPQLPPVSALALAAQSSSRGAVVNMDSSAELGTQGTSSPTADLAVSAISAVTASISLDSSSPLFIACVDGWGSFREFSLGVRSASAGLDWITDSSLVVPSGTEVGCTYYAVSISPEVGGFQAPCAVPEVSYRYTACSFPSQDSG